jgi:hypothetical protein
MREFEGLSLQDGRDRPGSSGSQGAPLGSGGRHCDELPPTCSAILDIGDHLLELQLAISGIYALIVSKHPQDSDHINAELDVGDLHILV